MGSEAVATSLSHRLWAEGHPSILALWLRFPRHGPRSSLCGTGRQVPPHQGLVLVPKVPRARLRCHHSDKGHRGVCLPL